MWGQILNNQPRTRAREGFLEEKASQLSPEKALPGTQDMLG